MLERGASISPYTADAILWTRAAEKLVKVVEILDWELLRFCNVADCCPTLPHFGSMDVAVVFLYTPSSVLLHQTDYGGILGALATHTKSKVLCTPFEPPTSHIHAEPKARKRC